MSDQIVPGAPANQFPGDPVGEGQSQEAEATGIPTTRLKVCGAGRTKDGPAVFVVGESDFIYAYAWALYGSYTIQSATFQLLSGAAPIQPPNGAKDFTTPVTLTRFTSSAALLVEADYLFSAIGMLAGTYEGVFVLTVITSDGDTEILTIPCLIQILSP